jgi:hypothetical protein
MVDGVESHLKADGSSGATLQDLTWRRKSSLGEWRRLQRLYALRSRG